MPSLEFLPRLVVYNVPLYETSKVLSNFMIGAPFLEIGLVKKFGFRVRVRVRVRDRAIVRIRAIVMIKAPRSALARR